MTIAKTCSKEPAVLNENASFGHNCLLRGSCHGLVGECFDVAAASLAHVTKPAVVSTKNVVKSTACPRVHLLRPIALIQRAASSRPSHAAAALISSFLQFSQLHSAFLSLSPTE
jgi:hypothetical protein